MLWPAELTDIAFKGPVCNINRDLLAENELTYTYVYICLSSIKSLKMNNVFSFTNIKHWYLNKEQVLLYEGHIAQPHFYSSSELGSTQDIVILPWCHSLYNTNLRLSTE